MFERDLADLESPPSPGAAPTDALASGVRRSMLPREPEPQPRTMRELPHLRGQFAPPPNHRLS